MAELMTQLGHDNFYLHGEDRGADHAYATAGLYRDRVLKLSFCEMLASGLGLEESNIWSSDSVSAQYRKQGVWCWHLSFFWIPHVPELLSTGKEREFWEMFMKEECYNPSLIEPKALDHWIDCSKQPGCLHGILESYRSAFKNGEINQGLAKNKLDMPVMTVGAPESFGPKVEECAKRFANNIVKSELFEECGHSLALEKP